MAWFCALLLLWLTAHGPPGPNSGHLHPNLFATEWSLEMRGEGFGSPMGADGEGGSCWSPIYAPQTYMGKGTKGSFGTVSQLPIAMKRSLRRATKRANQFGWSVYKGHILRGQTMSQIRHVDWQQLEPSDLARAKSTSWRAALVSWNCGGLTTELYQEILEWLRLHNITIMFLQGTRWREDRVWTVGDYSVIQSGEEFGPHHTHAGLLTFISKKFCNADDISYAVVDPGRILHVKCRIGAKSIDLINALRLDTNQVKLGHSFGISLMGSCTVLHTEISFAWEVTSIAPSLAMDPNHPILQLMLKSLQAFFVSTIVTQLGRTMAFPRSLAPQVVRRLTLSSCVHPRWIVQLTMAIACRSFH